MKPFEQLARRLRADLAAGTLPATGDALASQAKLAAHYHVAVPTMHNALGVLEKEGLVFARIGHGWFLADGPQAQAVRRYSQARTTLRAQILSGALPEGTKVTAPQVAERFGIPVAKAKRVLRALDAAGLVQVRPGSGSFVKPRQP